MRLAPHLTQENPPIHRFRLHGLKAWDFLDRLNKYKIAKNQQPANKTIPILWKKTARVRDGNAVTSEES